MTFSLELLILFAFAVLVSAIGFKNYVWFISLGYGFCLPSLLISPAWAFRAGRFLPKAR